MNIRLAYREGWKLLPRDWSGPALCGSVQGNSAAAHPQRGGLHGNIGGG